MTLLEKYPDSFLDHYIVMYCLGIDSKEEITRDSFANHSSMAVAFEGRAYLFQLLEDFEVLEKRGELDLLIECSKENNVPLSEADFRIMVEEIEVRLKDTKMVEVIEDFYEAFKNLDAEGMAACYHDDIVFEDPAFGILKGEKAKNMWRMLCGSQKKGNDAFVVEYSNIEASNDKGSAHWEAHYNFSQTGRKVHNIIDAEFEFKDGKIIRHTDTFDLHAWSKQALGLKGMLLGWTSFFKGKLQQQTNGMLRKFEAK